jgi:hypothetical protein
MMWSEAAFAIRQFLSSRSSAIGQQAQARRDLLIRLLGSFLVFALVNFDFMPDIREQNDFRRAASFSVLGLGAGGLRLPPVALL